jgi:preprotein translocase subunit SecG
MEAVMDLFYIVLVVAFCALSVALVYGLERLRGRQ